MRTQVCTHVEIKCSHKPDTNRYDKRHTQPNEMNTKHPSENEFKKNITPPPPPLLSSSFLLFFLQMRADTPLCPDLACLSNFSRLQDKTQLLFELCQPALVLSVLWQLCIHHSNPAAINSVILAPLQSEQS